MTEWTNVHVGLEGDSVAIGGIQLWNEEWRATGERMQLPHPDYPAQHHLMHVYDVGDPGRPVRFAAGELSNGVWGFYLPAN